MNATSQKRAGACDQKRLTTLVSSFVKQSENGVFVQASQRHAALHTTKRETPMPADGLIEGAPAAHALVRYNWRKLNINIAADSKSNQGVYGRSPDTATNPLAPRTARKTGASAGPTQHAPATAAVSTAPVPTAAAPISGTSFERFEPTEGLDARRDGVSKTAVRIQTITPAPV